MNAQTSFTTVRRVLSWCVLPLLVLLALVAAAHPAAAAFPGANGMIAFTSSRDGNEEIYVMNADGTNPIRLTTNSAMDQLPAWSSDGTKIAFMSQRDGSPEIHVMQADGIDPILRLTTNSATDYYPAWQPLPGTTPPVVYAFTGFFALVSNVPTLNSVQAGHSIRFKFSLGGNQGLAIFATDYPQSGLLTSCDPNLQLAGWLFAGRWETSA